MSISARTLAQLLVTVLLPASAQAESMAGVCPDGSAFIIHRLADVPCARAKFVSPSELPPLRPDLLPKPYPWLVDQEARDPMNPYNLIDAARQIRAARELRSLPGTRAEPLSGTPRPADVRSLSLGAQEVRDLIRLVELRQEIAPALIVVEGAQGDAQLVIRIAHSSAFEARAAQALGLEAGRQTVLAFTALASTPVEFHPNFFVVQASASFRPDPADRREVGLLVGAAGDLEPGTLLAGYLVVPARFDPAAEIELWWNDRHTRTVLSP